MKSRNGMLKRVFACVFALCIVFSEMPAAHAGTTILIKRGDSTHYHARKCSDGSYSAMELSTAQEQGYSACPVCYAPPKDDSEKDDSKPEEKPAEKPTEKPEDKPSEPEVTIPDISISESSLILVKGGKATLYVHDAVGSVEWTSSNDSVASVSKGTIKAKKAGKATITVRANGQKKTCSVVVEDPKMSKKQLTFVRGQKATLKLKGCKHKVTWSVGNKSIATVNSKGLVKAKGKGSTNVKATVHGKRISCKVKVETPSVSKSSITLYPGDSQKLTLKGCSHSVKWSTGNSSIATVSGGNVTAKSTGNTTIIASAHGKQYKCKVSVKKKAISIDPDTAKLEVGKTTSLKVSYIGFTSSDNKTVKWSTGNSNIAKVDDKGTITAVSTGETTITATCGDCSAVCTVRVIPEKFISFENSSVTVYEGQSANLKLNYVNYESSDSRDTTWNSSNTSVVTVSNGTITGKSAGNAVITATSGGRTAKCTIYVKKENLQLSETAKPMTVGEEDSLYVWLDGKTVPAASSYLWRIESGSGVVSLSASSGTNVTVKALKEGTAVIKVSYSSYSVKCTIKVTARKASTLSTNSVSVKIGEAQNVTVNHAYSETEEKTLNVKVYSSDESIVKVTYDSTQPLSNGFCLEGVAEGTATITMEIGSEKLVCQVQVTPAENVPTEQQPTEQQPTEQQPQQ